MSGRRTIPLAGLAAGTPAESTQTLVRGLSVLRAFRAGERYYGNKEIADRTGLPPSTVSRLCVTLVQLGYLRYSESTGKYALGPAVLSLAYPMLASLPIRQLARPLMKQLADSVEGQVSLAMRDGDSMVLLDTSRSPRYRHTLPEIGAAVPLFASAAGRAYLAAIPMAARNALRAEASAEGAGARLDKALRDYLRLGFTRSLGEVRPEYHACAVPLRSRIDGEVVVINCSVPVARIKGDEIESSVGPRLVALARQVDEVVASAPPPDISPR